MGARVFCVDGTNLVRTAYGYGGPAHAAQEDADSERLVGLLAGVCQDADGAIELELFFDGAFRPFEAAADGLIVRFARERPADELILDRVRAAAWRGGAVTVVTADGELGRQVVGEGGRWLKVEHGAAPESVARRIGGRFRR